tara:strand:- start:2760 stop:3155 length:396 start_codon:yes stop_codon:yes gene_type:complete
MENYKLIVDGIHFDIIGHCQNQLSKRFNFKKNELDFTIKSIIKNSIVIYERPGRARIKLKNNLRDSIYFFNESYNIILVVEKVGIEYSLIKTAYRASECNWIKDWKKTSKIRKTFKEVKSNWSDVDLLISA